MGGGVAGLTCAYFLARSGISVSLYERQEILGGFAASIRMGGGMIERHHHFICRGDRHYQELISDLSMDHHLRWKPARMSYLQEGKMFGFSGPVDLLKFSPVSLAGRIRFGMHIMRSRYRNQWKDLDGISAEDWLIDSIGSEAYEKIWYPLLKFKFHDFHRDVSAAWIWHRIWRVSSSRQGIFKPDDYGYLEKGSQMILDELERGARERGVEIRRGCTVTGTRYLPDKRIEIIVEGEEPRVYDRVIGALPLPILAKLVPPTEKTLISKLLSVRYLGVISALFFLKKTLTDSFWINIRDRRIPFNGIIEYSNLNPRPDLAPAKILYVPNYLPMDSPLFRKTDAELEEHYVSGLEKFSPGFSRDDIIEMKVSRGAFAQPVSDTGFLEKLVDVETGAPNLFIVDATQLYPSDRTIDGMIGLSKVAAELVRRSLF